MAFWKTQLVLFDWCNNTGATHVKMDGSVFKENSSFKMLGLFFSFQMDWDSYIIPIAKAASKQIGAFINFSEVALYLYISTVWNIVMSGLVPLANSWNW